MPRSKGLVIGFWIATGLFCLQMAFTAYAELRLPQVAGVTPNPHTLLNYLHARIARGERFAVWRHARRNVIDCEHVRALGFAAIEAGWRSRTVNIACTRDYAMTEIVGTMERVVRGHAVYDLLDRGAAYVVDVEPLRPLLAAAQVRFN